MNALMWLVVLVGILAMIAAVGWTVFNSNHPESRSSHRRRRDAPPSDSMRFYDGVDRPAGPDAEPMDPERLGGDHSLPGSSSQTRR